MSAALHLRITGRVQGVGYRAWTVRIATKLGLRGWVRNRADGSVEALAAGDPESLELFVEKCRRGPTFARVDDVAASPAESTGIATEGFRETATV